MTQEVLVLPRPLRPRDWFSSWPSKDRFGKFERSAEWLPRQQAERTSDYWQPIPSALLRNAHGDYCLLRRTNAGRSDLKRRFTLVVGGHVDEIDFRGPLTDLLERTVIREISEEVGVEPVSELSPRGVIADLGSVDGTRHVAFLYETVVDEASLRLGAPEEFSRYSKVRLQFLPLPSIQRLKRWLDPWSALILEFLLDADSPRQARMEFA